MSMVRERIRSRKYLAAAARGVSSTDPAAPMFSDIQILKVKMN